VTPLRISPLRLFRTVAVAEACTWALLLVGMFLKYVTHTTELGVRVGGMLHGVVFIAFCVVTVGVGIDQRWTKGRILLGLLSAIPPFVTIWFDRSAEKRRELGDTWRLAAEEPKGSAEAFVRLFVCYPRVGFPAAVLTVLMLTGVALLVGPPGS